MSYITNKDFYLKVAMGEVPNHSIMSKFGQNSDVGTAAYEAVWDGGGTYTYPADGSADITKIVSTAADTGTAEVQGLDVNGDLVVQNATLNGTTAVTLTTPLWRVFRIKNMGSTDWSGDVTCTDGTTTYAKVQAGNNQTLMALYTIPNGYTGYMLKGTNSLAGVSRSYAVAGKMSMRPYGGVFQLKKTFGLQSDGSSFFEMDYPLPAKIAGKTDIKVEVISSASGGVVNTTFDILLVKD